MTIVSSHRQQSCTTDFLLLVHAKLFQVFENVDADSGGDIMIEGDGAVYGQRWKNGELYCQHEYLPSTLIPNAVDMAPGSEEAHRARPLTYRSSWKMGRRLTGRFSATLPYFFQCNQLFGHHHHPPPDPSQNHCTATHFHPPHPDHLAYP